MEQIDITDARRRLDELLRRAGGGEQFLLTDAGKWLALLTAPPPPPPTEEEIAAIMAAHIARADEAIAQLEAMREERLAELEGRMNAGSVR